MAELSDRQKLFLDLLFGECKGDPEEAKKKAGYSPNTQTSEVIQHLKDELLERAKLHLASNAGFATNALVKVLKSPGKVGDREAILAAKEVLDRIGVVKVEKIDHTVSTDGAVFVLPAKRPVDDSGDE